MTTGEGDRLADRVADLEHRMTVAEAILAVQALKARYAELVDDRFSRGAVVAAEVLARVAADIAALFTSDGVWDGGPVLGTVSGRTAIAARLGDPTLVFSRHLFVNPRIRVDDDRATGRWDLLSPCRDARGVSYWMCGYEDDEYRRVDGTWLLSAMRLTTVFMAPVGEGFTEVLH